MELDSFSLPSRKDACFALSLSFSNREGDAKGRFSLEGQKRREFGSGMKVVVVVVIWSRFTVAE